MSAPRRRHLPLGRERQRGRQRARFGTRAGQLLPRGPLVFRWHAEDDGRTCPQCLARAGHVYTAAVGLPPLHHFCRCHVDYLGRVERRAWARYLQRGGDPNGALPASVWRSLE